MAYKVITLPVVLSSQVLLLVYHQVTTLVDLYPFNGVRYYTLRERVAETGVNAVLMSLGPIGFFLHLHGLMTFGVAYYFVLFAIEIVIWWVPYLFFLEKGWRKAYNIFLAIGISDFGKGDTLSRWLQVHSRLHAGTLTFVPRRPQRIVPNLEHVILNVLTFLTAMVTWAYFRE